MQASARFRSIARLFYVAEMMQLMKITRNIKEAGDLFQDVYTSGQPTYVHTLPHRTPIAICLSPWDPTSTMCWGKATKFVITMVSFLPEAEGRQKDRVLHCSRYCKSKSPTCTFSHLPVCKQTLLQPLVTCVATGSLHPF